MVRFSAELITASFLSLLVTATSAGRNQAGAPLGNEETAKYSKIMPLSIQVGICVILEATCYIYVIQSLCLSFSVDQFQIHLTLPPEPEFLNL
jgi:hypothetical protein